MEGCKTDNKNTVYYGVHIPSDEQIQEGEDGVYVFEVSNLLRSLIFCCGNTLLMFRTN